MFTTLILASLGTAHATGGVVVDVVTARRSTSEPKVVATTARIAQHAALGSTDALVDDLRTVLSDPALDAAAREWLLESGLHTLRRLPASADARALAAELSVRPPAVFVHVEPEHGRRALPLYDAGAAARFLQREWTRRDARAVAEKSLRVGNAEALETWLRQGDSAGGVAVRDGIADAFGEADAASLRRQRPAVVAAMLAGHDADRLSLSLARRLRDPELMAITIKHAEPAVALATVEAAVHEFESGVALGLLETAADRESVASAALLAIGRLAATDASAQRLLLDRIHDPVSGDSAAAALARMDDPGLPSRLGALLLAEKDEQTRRRLVLALKLNDGPGAREALRRLVESKQGSLELRQETAAWLSRGR